MRPRAALREPSRTGKRLVSDITKLPIVPKPRPEEKQIQLLQSWDKKCQHIDTGIVVDEALLEVTCRACGEKLSPVWVLARLAERESLWSRSREAYVQEAKRAKERRRTKCEHCKQMTRIRNL